jgi:hypothetical protein
MSSLLLGLRTAISKAFCRYVPSVAIVSVSLVTFVARNSAYLLSVVFIVVRVKCCRVLPNG